MNKQLTLLALIGFATSASALNLKMADLDAYGTAANGTNTVIVTPDNDAYASIGGSSQVTDANGTCLGECGDADQWNLGTAIVDGKIVSKLKVTAWVPSSAGADAWPWANAGWFIIPKATTQNPDWWGGAEGAGYTTNTTVTLVGNYTAGKKLTLQLKVKDDDAAWGPPRLETALTGTASVKISSFKRANWSTTQPTSFDAAKVIGFGMLRIVSGNKGAAFPATEATPTDFTLESYDDGGIGPIAVLGSINGVELNSVGNTVELTGLNGQASKIELVNSLGQVVASGTDRVSTADLQGAYFVRATVDGQTLVKTIAK